MMNIVVASSNADQLEMFESCAAEIGAQMNLRVPVTVRSGTTVEEVRNRINQQTELLIVASSLAGTRRELDDGLDLVKALASNGVAPACIVVGRLELLRTIQAI